MALGKILLEPDTLWKSVKERTEHALQCGALLSIPTEFEFVEQDGVRFLVRILSNLNRKKAAKKKQEKQTAISGEEFNPFLPYEEDLFVADISDTHVCILNKFNVVDYHLLLITRAFEEQENLLTLADFAAMWACLADFDGLVFYNSGKIAGASQRHKHLQIVPLPLVPSGVQIPIEPLLTEAKFQDGIATIPGFAFVHAFTTLNPLMGAESTLERYHGLLQAVDFQPSGAYNLLVTREWMLIVLRSHEEFEKISINSLGFAGALLVRNQQQMQILQDYGPMTILRKVAVPTL
ncbi:ATP adenylyltransferase (5',5'''-P-1,P-4-tetraphosphate phosphorylase II) [Cylindrospermum stagnale PCC 7417]|uniref:ATP adenylyltransferase (5',5'''-P-1,P-4-tetraphosphate phosphorylase II) n=1 Tax=Cylindrospermum stagnale PCC 7417 TaxID=56107 RepID=K9WX63_9NOST|nr:ATP adenylyltransferase (5',5'''-P-1,P-4-tetraphosphate phosphorylase II) [Cylindrospermum stagnale]AFZ24409.1 ATP adenylyltransferase (5',5'''-P-1,P-4-tetraphosphate phosphorylase II) [Cylindrospermum stagnale PCC 7417]